MIYGTGIDLVENDRMEKIIAKWGDKFLTRVFTPGEIAYCGRHRHSAIHYVARFAAKESFLKAIGTGMGRGVQMLDIEVVNEQGGKPLLRLHGEALRHIRKAGVRQIHLSVTHTKNYAQAMVVLEK